MAVTTTSGGEKLLFSIDNLVALYGYQISSINTIWNIYVFVLLGIVGWAIVRAHEFERTQKILITIVLLSFNAVMLFYFRDAYNDIHRIEEDLRAALAQGGLRTVQSGISEELIAEDPIRRFHTVAVFLLFFGVFALVVVWSGRIWNRKQEPDSGGAVSGSLSSSK